MPSPFLVSRGLETEAALLSAGLVDDARRLLSGRAGAATAVASTRAALELGDSADALLSAQRAVEEASDATDLLFAKASRAVACAHAVRPLERFDARDLVGADPLLLPEALLEIASAYAATGDQPAAHRWLALAEPSDPYVLARHLLLRARLAGMQADFREQSQLAAEALHRIEPHASGEAVVFREAARTCAASAREILPDSPAAFSRIARSGAADDQTRCDTLRAQAWLHGLRAEYDRAIVTLMQATQYARTPMLHTALFADLAAVAVLNGDAHSPFAQAALDAAVSSLPALRCEDAALDEALVVPQLLQTAAEMQREQIAQRCEDLAKRILRRHDARMQEAAFRRYAALLHESQAFAYAHKDERSALRHAREAHAAFEGFRYDWRAGRVALLIYQLTGLREWEQRAKTHLRAYRTSRMYALLDAGGAQRLTRRQQQVLEAVLDGKSLIQIAMRLRISEETVRKHLGPVMRHYGVKTRIELLAKLRRHSKDQEATFQKSDTIGSGANP